MHDGEKYMVDKYSEIGMTEEEFERMYVEATRRGEEDLARRIKAVAARFDTPSKRIVLDLENGVTLMVPTDLIQGLQTDDQEALADFELFMEGSQIHWETLDAQFYVEDLLYGGFGTPKWMAGLRSHLGEIGRKGGRSRTEAKRTASAENGKKGGRPRIKRTA